MSFYVHSRSRISAKILQSKLHPVERFSYKHYEVLFFLDGMHLNLGLCNKNILDPNLYEIFIIFFTKVDFYMQIFLQYLENQ